jgi:hypothetical protein
MQLKSTLTLIVMFAIVSQSFGQGNPPKKISNIKVNELNVMMGWQVAKSDYASLNDFRMLAPQSQLLNNDFPGFSIRPPYTYRVSNYAYSMMLGLQFANKEKTGYRPVPVLRIGFSYFNGQSLSNSMYKDDRYPYDTFTSSQTGQQIFIDSTSSEHYGMYYTYDQLRLDVSMKFRTNPKRRFSFYAGIGFTAGVVFNAQTTINYYKSSNITTQNHNYYIPGTFAPSNSFSQSENFYNKTGFGYSAYFMLGVDFRLGNKGIWKYTHLFYEMRYGIMNTDIPEINANYTKTYMRHSFGLRITF